jgi:uncharacterized protein YkwD
VHIIASRTLLLLVILAPLTGIADAAQATAARQPAQVVVQRVVELVNKARSEGRRCGKESFPPTAPLASAPPLDDAAAAHARDMATRDYFAHRGADGSAPRDRVSRAGYPSRLTGENIASGPESAEEVVAGWLDSPGHCANIMDARFRHIGVGFAAGRKDGRLYWVQTFGAPGGASR